MMAGSHSQADPMSGMTSHHATGLASYSEHSRMTSQPHDNMGSSMRLPATGTVAPQMSSVGASTGSQVAGSVLSGLSQVHSQFPGVTLSMNSMPMLSPTGTHYSSASSSLGKPYRPWGAELAY